MIWLPADRSGDWRARAVRFAACVTLTAALAGCVDLPKLNPLTASGVDPDSTVAAEVVAAERAPGPYPKFSQIPAVPSDVRPVAAWRKAVVAEWGVKRKIEREASALPFTLANTEGWAARERSKIPLPETIPPTPNAGEQTEAFAAGERARATPPPPPN